MPSKKHLRLSGSWLLSLTLFIAVCIWLASGILWPSAGLVVSAKSPIEQPRFKVRVTSSTAQPMDNRLSLLGHTQPNRQVTLKAQTYGEVVALVSGKGSRVAADTALVRLDLKARQLQLQQARAVLQEAQLSYQASRSLQRKGLQGEAELASAKARLEAAKAAVVMAELELTHLTIRAPFAGVVEQHHVEVGDYVGVGDVITTLLELDPVTVVGEVAEKYLPRLQKQQLCDVVLRDGRRFSGHIQYVSQQADAVTRTFRVEVSVANPDQAIKAGVTATLNLPLRERHAHQVAPSTLTLSASGEIGVKAVDQNRQVVFYPVTLLGESTQGLWLGQLPDTVDLITVGQEFVKAGEVVEVAYSTPAKATPSHD